MTRDTAPARDELAAALTAGGSAEDLIRLRGQLRVERIGQDGNLIEAREVENLITTVGRAAIVELLLAAPAANQKPTHMGVGTSSTAAAVGDTTITGETRVALTSKSRAGNVLTMVGDWAAGSATGTLQEAGLWDLAAAGQLLARAVFGAITKAAGDTLKITWTWTIG